MNIIPIIAKADTISKSELHKFKIKIMGELVSNGVQIYQFPTDDEAVAEINAVMNVSGGGGAGSLGSRARGLRGTNLNETQFLEALLFRMLSLGSPAQRGGGHIPPRDPVGMGLEDLLIGFALRVP